MGKGQPRQRINETDVKTLRIADAGCVWLFILSSLLSYMFKSFQNRKQTKIICDSAILPKLKNFLEQVLSLAMLNEFCNVRYIVREQTIHVILLNKILKYHRKT